MKLNQDEREDLKDLITHPGFKALMSELEALVIAHERDVLNLVLESSNDRELLIRKARAEGARRLASGIKLKLDNLTGKKSAS